MRQRAQRPTTAELLRHPFLLDSPDMKHSELLRDPIAKFLAYKSLHEDEESAHKYTPLYVA